MLRNVVARWKARQKSKETAPPPGCEWVACVVCGATREIPKEHPERGPQWCRSCGERVA